MARRFSPLQILLHWSVALLVLSQFLTDDAMGGAWRALRRGTAEPDGLLVVGHVAGGILILALALWRITLRITRGVPPATLAEPRSLRLAAAATHHLLYLLLLVLPITGLAAWFGGFRPAAGLHETLTTLLLAMVALHVTGAAYQQFVLRSDVVSRILPRRIRRAGEAGGQGRMAAPGKADAEVM